MNVLWIGVGMEPDAKKKPVEYNGKLLLDHASPTNIFEGLGACVEKDKNSPHYIGENPTCAIGTSKWVDVMNAVIEK